MPDNFPTRRSGLPVWLWGMIFTVYCVTSAFSQKYNWLDFGSNPQHDNFDQHEEILTRANVGRLKPLWSVSIGGWVDREPLYVHDLKTIAGKKDVVFVNTKKGECAAFDALTGAKIWKTPPLCDKGGARESEANCVIDPALQYIFVYGTDGYVYKLKTYDGSQVTDGGWPIQAHPSPKEVGYSLGIFTAKNGVSYLTAKNSQGLGHIVTINLKDNTRHVFTQGKTTIVDLIVTNQHGGACGWGRAGGVYDPDLDVIYLATACNNGGFDPTNHSYGQCVLKIKYDGTSDRTNAPMDSYTASNVNPKYGTKIDGYYQTPGDRDVGSTDPLILPTGICPRYPHLLVQGGKDAWVRIINRDDMSGKGSPGNLGGELFKTKLPQTAPEDDHGVMSQPTLYVDPEDHSTWVIVGSQSGICGLKFKLTADGLPAFETVWSRSIDGDMDRNGNVNTATATATGLLFYSNGGLQSGSRQSTLFCVDIKTGDPLWQTIMGPHHWASQIVASGMVFYPNGRNNSTLTAFTVDGKPPIEARSAKRANFHQ